MSGSSSSGASRRSSSSAKYGSSSAVRSRRTRPSLRRRGPSATARRARRSRGRSRRAGGRAPCDRRWRRRRLSSPSPTRRFTPSYASIRASTLVAYSPGDVAPTRKSRTRPPRDGAPRRRSPGGSRTFVTVAKRPARVTPSQVPPLRGRDPRARSAHRPRSVRPPRDARGTRHGSRRARPRDGNRFRDGGRRGTSNQRVLRRPSWQSCRPGVRAFTAGARHEAFSASTCRRSCPARARVRASGSGGGPRSSSRRRPRGRRRERRP